MAEPTLAAAGALSILVGTSFGAVARAVSRRGATNSRRWARRAHAAWWLSLGAYLALQGALTMVAGFGALTLPAYLASRLVAIPLLCLAVWGITFYLSYLYTGSTRAAAPLGVLYVLVAGAFFYATFAEPQSLRVDTWLVGLDDSSPLYRAIYLLVGLPPIVAAFAYLALLPRIEEREQRYRIVLLSGSILLYVGSGLAARLAASDLVIFLTLVVLGLGAAGASLAAYYPPPAVRRALRGGA